MSPQVEPEFMSQQSSAVASAVMNISIKLHHTQDYYKDMAAATIILYAVRYNHVLVGFIWAVNYDSNRQHPDKNRRKS